MQKINKKKNTTASGQLAPSGPVSPVDQVNDKLKSLLINLQRPLEQLSNLTLTIKNIGNVISQGNIPAGCTPVCRLGIPNPPEKVTTTWNRCLFECGKQLTAILVTYHNKCHEDLLNSINMKIKEEFDTLTVTYEGRVPELQSKLNHTKSQITLLQQEAEEKCSKNRKRGNVDQPNSQNKKSKDQASEEPSSIESQVKQAIDKAR